MTIIERYGTVLRLWDAPKYVDRYTIMPPRWARDYREARGFLTLGCSAEPFHPQGVGQHSTAIAGSHLGRRIRWADLPADVQRAARNSFPEYAPKE